jgi:archaellum component FlaC
MVNWQHRLPAQDTNNSFKSESFSLICGETEMEGIEDEMEGIEDEMEGNEDEMEGNEDEMAGNEDEIEGIEHNMEGTWNMVTRKSGPRRVDNTITIDPAILEKLAT